MLSLEWTYKGLLAAFVTFAQHARNTLDYTLVLLRSPWTFYIASSTTSCDIWT